jgi:hypothetical protein
MLFYFMSSSLGKGVAQTEKADGLESGNCITKYSKAGIHMASLDRPSSSFAPHPLPFFIAAKTRAALSRQV